MNQRPTESTKQFFDQWQLYQQIIEQNYMAHQGIHRVIRQLINDQFTTPFQFLDLGCGDAQAIATTLTNSQVDMYTGVDLSPNALNLAIENRLFRHKYGKGIPSRRIWRGKAMLARREDLCM